MCGMQREANKNTNMPCSYYISPRIQTSRLHLRYKVIAFAIQFPRWNEILIMRHFNCHCQSVGRFARCGLNSEDIIIYFEDVIAQRYKRLTVNAMVVGSIYTRDNEMFNILNTLL